MVGKKFCLVGVDNDFIDLIEDKSSNFLGYFSEDKKYYSIINRKKRIGDHNLRNWLEIKKKFNPQVFITIDDGVVREKLLTSIYKKNCKNLLFKNIVISKSSKKNIKSKFGIIIQNYSKIMPNVKIGNGVKININSQIHHDCNIDDYATIGPKALLLGNVKVGKYSYIGANSTIKQNIKIGKGSIIGAGAVVLKDVKNFDIVAGVPARTIKTNE